VSEETPPGIRPNNRLSGWKEIAAHLGRGVRTVQRWEKDYAMPVRRLGLGKGETVFAFSAELDDWLVTSEADSARADADSTAADVSDKVESSDEARADRWQTGITSDPRDLSRRITRRTLALAAVLIGCMALGVIGYHFVATLWLTPKSAPAGETKHAGGLPAEPASLRVDFDTLTALDSTGATLWHYSFGFPLAARDYAPGAIRLENRLGIVDIDGDTHREVLIVTRSEEASQENRQIFVVLNGDGTVRWSHQIDAHTVAVFGSKSYDGPWVDDLWFVTTAPEDTARKALWVASHHSQMFPAILQRLDPRTGAVLSNYWNDGHILAVNVAPIDGRQRVLVGSCNNETKGAALALLDADRPTGAAPSAQADYRCRNCPPGDPLSFLVIPKPRQFARMDTSSCVFKIDRMVGGFTVGVRHVVDENNLVADVYYALDDHLQPKGVTLGDGYNLLRDGMIRRGIIAAPASAQTGDSASEFLPLLGWNGSGYSPVPKVASTAAGAR